MTLPCRCDGEVQLIRLMETVSLSGKEEEEEEVWQKSVCRLLLIPASLSEMIWEIILIILNAITVSPAPLHAAAPAG